MTTIHDAVTERARWRPDHVAVRDAKRALTYAELDAHSGRIARALRAQGVRPGDRVGIYLDRTVDLVAGVLGVLRAGAGYVPLDPEFPGDRLAFMVEDAGVDVVLTERALAGAAPGRTNVFMDTAAPAGDALPAVDPDAVAYVIYTSGSTGKPKGVRVSHRSVVNLLRSMAAEPGISADDTWLAVTTLSFDISVLELFGPLLAGATVVVASRDEVLDGTGLRRALSASGATVLQATPVAWRMLLEAGWRGDGRLKALCGGEALPQDLAQKLVPEVGALWNMYGPTETTIWSTCFHVRDGARPILIGHPVAETTVYILDKAGRQQPVGVPGEIYIGGTGVALGYHNRDDLTRERFLPDPFTDAPGARMYRTGDMGRYLRDGNLEYRGRADNQVKIRGFRVELGEIEAALAACDGVRQAVVVIHRAGAGDDRLVAFVQAQGAMPSADSLRARLATRLPQYMIPQHFVATDAYPTTPNGKVDRKALTESLGALPAVETPYVEPRTPSEQLVAATLADILGLERVSADGNFFDLGGHSVLAMRVVARLRTTAPRIGFRDVFQAPTVSALAARIDALASERVADPIPRIAREGGMPLGFVQQRMWLLDRLDPTSTASNLPGSWMLRGALDVAAFRAALTEVVRRHEILRTRIVWDGDVPRQVVEPVCVPDLPVIDLTGVAEAERHAELLRRFEDERSRVFDLQVAPLFRARLFRMDAGKHVFFFMPHHVVWDGWSFDILLAEMATLYAAFAEGRPSPLPELRVQYADYASWHRRWIESGEVERQRQFWRERLHKPLPVLELPTLRPRPAVMSQRGRRSLLPIEPALVDRLRALGREEGATLFMVLLAAYKAFLHRYTGQGDVIVGAPVQDRVHVDAERMIGVFVNTLVLRTQVDGQQSFRALLRQVRDTCVAAYDNQSVPFDQLVEDVQPERSLSHTPLFQTLFTFQETTDRPTQFGDLTLSQVHVPTHSAPTDVLYGVMASERNTLALFDLNADLFDEAAAARFTAGYGALLSSAAHAADAPLTALELLPDAERERVVHAFNATERPVPDAAAVGDLIARQIERRRDHVAVEDAHARLTYGELDARASYIAARLAAAGVGPGGLVAVCLDRSVDLVAAVLGIWRCGAAYLPLDPEYPAARIGHVVSDSGAGIVLTTSTLLGVLPAECHGTALCLDRPDGADPRARATPRADAALAYVIYTSGSTGTPKGVEIAHRAVVNFLASMMAEPGLRQSDVLLAVTTLAFDISVLELFLPLAAGARVVIAGTDQARDGARLVALFQRARPTVMQATPSTWQMMFDAGWTGSPGLKALCGGEALGLDLATRLAACTGDLWNMYGPTETTIWSTCGRFATGDTRVTIGRPIANTQVHVLDERRRPVPIGVPGEAVIGGAGVAVGYHGRPDLTAERFVPDPIDPARGTAYRTGDLVRWLDDGRLEHLGRLDRQVKLRGFRIEPGEVEAVLAGHPSVLQVVVDVRPTPRGVAHLVAYVVARNGAPFTTDDARQHLRRHVPEYMVPSVVVPMERLPLTPNGKIDRNALPEPGASQRDPAAHEPPRTETEHALAGIWRELLRVDRIGRTDNFFELGGDSLLVLRLSSRLRGAFQVDVPVRTLFEAPTVAELGAAVEDAILASVEAMTDDEAAAQARG